MSNLSRLFQPISKDLVSPTERVVVGFSGGPDSVYLMHLLIDYFNTRDQIIPVYCNHHLRPESECEAELAFVKAWFKEHQIQGHVIDLDCSKENQGSVEGNARKARYQALAKICEQTHTTKLVTAHHQDDAAEAVLLKLFRGSGFRMGGMRPVISRRDLGLTLVRPLLKVSKSEILKRLNQHQLPFFEDTTNTQLRYSRNRIRHQIIPVAQRINRQAVPHILEFSDYWQANQAFITDMLALALGQVQHYPTSVEIDRSVFLGVHPFLKGPLVVMMAEQLMPDGHGLQLNQITPLLNRKEGEFRMNIAGGLWLWMDETKLSVSKPHQGLEHWVVPIKGSEDLTLPNGYQIRLEIIPNTQSTWHTSAHKTYLDYDQLSAPELRFRRPGDRLQTSAHESQTIGRLLRMADIPKWHRDRALILESRGDIACVAGVRVSPRYYVSEKTTQVLAITDLTI